MRASGLAAQVPSVSKQKRELAGPNHTLARKSGEAGTGPCFCQEPGANSTNQRPGWGLPRSLTSAKFSCESRFSGAENPGSGKSWRQTLRAGGRYEREPGTGGRVCKTHHQPFQPAPDN